MKMEIKEDEIRIVPETDQDRAYLRDTLKSPRVALEVIYCAGFEKQEYIAYLRVVAEERIDK